MLPLVINWPLSSTTGYGIYGLQILLSYIKRGGHEFALTDFIIPPIAVPPPLNANFLAVLEQVSEAARLLDKNPKETLRFNHPVLHGVGNCFSRFKNQYRVKGQPNVGCAAIEEPICPPDWKPFLQIYDMFIAISQWNAEFLSSLDLAPVHLCYQGVDTSLFCPSSTQRQRQKRFIIFSGGKFEFRKGQDIVLAAFKRFHERHPDSMLVAAWQNSNAVDPAPFATIGHCDTTPVLTASGDLNIEAWLLQEGLEKNSFIALPWVINADMPKILHNCDVAIFPNRCEGGTNLVAMEAMACGLPTFVSNNTGQKDLVDLLGCGVFKDQNRVKAAPGIESVEGWGETDVDEIIAVLESVYSNSAEAKRQSMVVAEKVKEWDWDRQNEKLLQKVMGNIPSSLYLK